MSGLFILDVYVAHALHPRGDQIGIYQQIGQGTVTLCT